MKKNYARVEMIMLLAAVLVIIVMAAATAYSYADTYRTSLVEGKEVAKYWEPPFDENAVTYIEITPSKTGTITYTTDFDCWVTLCDENKEELSKGYYESGDCIAPGNTNDFMRKVHYGVKKGKTYKLKVVNMPKRTDSEGDYVGVMKYTTTKVKAAKYGSSKKKAKAIKKNKKIKGLFVGGNKKAQWYKITNKQKKTKIYITADKINYALNFKVYYKSGGKWYDTTDTLTWQTDYKKDTLTGTITKKVKHTYYIKVYPEGKTSGSYTIKWK